LKTNGKISFNRFEEEKFSEKALELFKCRKNFLTQNPGNQDARYRTDGCPGAVTSASALTTLATGKDVKEAKKINCKLCYRIFRRRAKEACLSICMIAAELWWTLLRMHSEKVI